ncbi:hypothetical protein L5515_006559 [Caenorhabditis briggsae]|uniref:Uncharacterized protein n=1 Tax=Caenorhabditis briggsae TaxID=6238 RepID=A0AAE9F1V0_CAEBR|nr:hypothetical protein L5515_006559 [Caenorhabditis briggsae]
MQTKFLRAISIQIVVPLIVLAMPMFYIGISIVANFYNQVLNNLITIIVSTHGLASTFVMLIIHEPYWKYCRTLFAGIGTKVSANKVVIIVSITNRETPQAGRQT